LTFFINGPDGAHTDTDYKAIRDLPHNTLYRAFIENLWARYQPPGDGGEHFLKDATIHFRQRFWEMYLFCTLKDRGISVHKTNGIGPDFSIEIGGNKYWVEAVAPTAGSGSDQVPYPLLRKADYAPEIPIRLRYTNAFDTKFRCWQNWENRNVVNGQDGYIIAINGLAIPYADCDCGYPFIIQSLFPVGPFAVNVDRESLAVSDPYLRYEDTIHKQNAAPANTAPFMGQKYSAVSAIIHSFAGYSNGASLLGYDFLLLRNPCARRPLPIGSLSWCTQYSFETGQLTCQPISSAGRCGE
jgi:hypothetical protein